MKRIYFNYVWMWDHIYIIPSISLHNYANQFCIWINFLGLSSEIIFVKD